LSRPEHLHTRTVTLVVQRVCKPDEAINGHLALALLEYVADVLNGNGGRGQFERHVTANRCRIEAIASVAPVPGGEAQEGLAATDGAGALRARLEDALEMLEYLPGGENAGEVATALGYTPETASAEIRAKLTEALEALQA
jgi:hypothetical protein